MLSVLLARRHTTSTVAVRERIRKAQRNMMISIPFSALSEEVKKRLIAFEDDEREHKRQSAVKKVAAFRFRDESFDAPPVQEDDSESSMSRYVTYPSAEVDKDKDDKKDEENNVEDNEDDDEEGMRYSIEDFTVLHAPVPRVPFPFVPVLLPPPPIPASPPVPPVPDEIEIIDVDLLDD